MRHMQGDISKNTAANVLYHFRREGFPGGSFTEALLVAFSKADNENHMKLTMAFPEEGEAMFMAKNYPDGIDRLRAILKGDHDG